MARTIRTHRDYDKLVTQRFVYNDESHNKGPKAPRGLESVSA